MKNKRNTLSNKTDQQFPGYPKYPADEDIMNRGERVVVDENTSPIKGAESLDLENGVSPENDPKNLKAPGNPDPIDAEDAEYNNDEELEKRVYPVDFSGKDLDVPGAELDDETENTGNEDEENNAYSLGNLDQ
jgi:hypothetical protein